jgi:UDP-N-acetylmuramate-alanine ligase
MPHMSARYIATLPEVTSYLLQNLKSGDVVIVMSAGDADQINSDLMKAFQER